MSLTRFLEASVFDDGAIVTYLTLAREKCLSAAEAKRCAPAACDYFWMFVRVCDCRVPRLLAEFKDNQGDAVTATHLISGTVNGVHTYKVADDKSVEGERATCGAVFCPCNGIVVFECLCFCISEYVCMSELGGFPPVLGFVLVPCTMFWFVSVSVWVFVCVSALLQLSAPA